jgi:hypothetical protein
VRDQGTKTALKALSRREAAIFAAVADVYCEPDPVFPPVSRTDSINFIDELAAGSPRLNRMAFRALLGLLQLAPLPRHRARFTGLERERRARFVRGLDKSRWLLPRITSRLLKTLAIMSYYGDEGVLRAAGYDPAANLARARAVRREEGRP